MFDTLTQPARLGTVTLLEPIVQRRARRFAPELSLAGQIADAGDGEALRTPVALALLSFAGETESPSVEARTVETVREALPKEPVPAEEQTVRGAAQPLPADLEPQPLSVPERLQRVSAKASASREEGPDERNPQLAGSLSQGPDADRQATEPPAVLRHNIATERPTIRPAGFLSAGEDSGFRGQHPQFDVGEAAFPKAAIATDFCNWPTRSRLGCLGGDEVLQPVRILWQPEPRYPQEALRRHLEGDVVVDVEFRYSGTLEVLEVKRSPDPTLMDSALEAIRKVRFVPARKDGRAVDQQTRLRVRFRLA